MARAEKTENMSEVPKQNRALSAIIVLAVLLCLSIGVAGYFYYQYKNVVPVKSEVDEITSLIKTLGAMIELPEGETPTLATVTDRDKLAEQPFFQKAENGDKVLIYANTGRAILYRPSTKKIVDITTVNVNSPSSPASGQAPADTPLPVLENTTPPADPATAATPEVQSAKIALYNGSSKVGVTNTLDDEIRAAFPDVEIVVKEKAAKSDYQGNLIIDLSGKNADLAKKLADSFGGTVGTLPAGEVTPVSDILIIIGNKS